jgi:hypothetical protein
MKNFTHAQKLYYLVWFGLFYIFIEGKFACWYIKDVLIINKNYKAHNNRYSFQPKSSVCAALSL